LVIEDTKMKDLIQNAREVEARLRKYLRPDSEYVGAINSLITALEAAQEMNKKQQSLPEPWVKFNSLTHCYETKDGTSVPAELMDNVECLADVLKIAVIRDRQRAAQGAKP